jgi:2-oxoisovalerate dehydrogenase E1 component beta subunit
MAELSMVQALNAALRHCLAGDDRTLVFGQDVGRLGGVFRVTDGLQREFGERRVFDTPLAESGIVGVAVGLAMAGWRPVPEIQFDGFSFPALDQMLTNLAKYRSRSRGAYDMAVTLRLPSYGGIGGPEHHSESPESIYAHTAGLKVVTPSGAQEAFNLLVAAIRDPDPVIFMEPKSRYWAKEEVALEPAGLPIGRARVVRAGSDATLVAWGPMVHRCLQAATAAEEDGVSLGVLDLRSLVPLDEEALLTSVSETGRAVVVHEAPRTAGFAAEVSARLMEGAFGSLRAPVQRVTGWDVPYPSGAVEQQYIPSVDRILLAVQRALDY